MLFGHSFPEKRITGIEIISENEINVGSVEVLPYETDDSAGISGFVYFDSAKTRPAENINVWAENDGTPFGNAAFTQVKGFYILEGLTAGTYELFAQIENNINDTIEILISENNYGSAVMQDIILPNEAPVLNARSPLDNEIRAAYNEDLVFTLDVYDTDNDNLLYDWSCTQGTLSVTLNTAALTTDFHGESIVSCDISDMKGETITVSWLIRSGWVQEDSTGLPNIKEHSLVSLDGKLWIFGGFSNGNYLDYIYSSDNGKDWIFEGNAPFTGRANHSTVKLNDKIYIFAGRTGYQQYINDVWHTEDGLNWIMDTDEAQFSDREGAISFALDNKLWIVSGYKYVSGHYRFTDTHTSTDGISWTLEQDNTLGFDKRDNAAVEYFNNRIYMIAGKNAWYWNDVWETENGMIWGQTTSEMDSNIAERANHDSCIHEDKVIIGGGYNGSALSDYWYSEDMESWAEIPDSPVPANTSRKMISFNGLIYLVGETEVWTLKL